MCAKEMVTTEQETLTVFRKSCVRAKITEFARFAIAMLEA